MTFYFGEELPLAGADIALLHRSAVHGDGGNSSSESAIKDGVEVIPAFGRIIQATTHFYRDGNFCRHCIARSPYNFQRDFSDLNDLVITYTDQDTGATNKILLDDILPDNGAASSLASATATTAWITRAPPRSSTRG